MKFLKIERNANKAKEEKPLQPRAQEVLHQLVRPFADRCALSRLVVASTDLDSYQHQAVLVHFLGLLAG